MVRGEELRKDTREQLDLARRPNDEVVDVTTGVDIIFDTLEQERMLADLSQLHERVIETLQAELLSARRSATVGET